MGAWAPLVVSPMTVPESQLDQMAEEQAALRRVAALVAQGAAPEGVFAAVVEEIGRLLSVEYARMGRYEPDDTLAVRRILGHGMRALPWRRLTLGGKNLATIVFETGRSARIDSYADASGPIGVATREGGVRSAVGTPITVEGRLWGVMVASSLREQTLAANAESRLASFTELLATTIANAESRAGVTRLAADQAALRRVATLVARAVPPEEVFAAVVEEVGRLLPVDFADLGRCESDGTITFVAGWGKTRAVFPIGARLTLGGKNATSWSRRPVGQPGSRVCRCLRADRRPDQRNGRSLGGWDARHGRGAPVGRDGRWLEPGGTRPADTEPRLAQSRICWRRPSRTPKHAPR